MDETGVAIIDVGYPAVSEAKRKTVKMVAAEGYRQASIAAPARAVRADVDVCLECGVDEIPVFVAFSDLHLKYNLRMTKEQVIKRAVDCIEYAKKHGVIVDFVTEDTQEPASTRPFRSLKQPLKPAGIALSSPTPWAFSDLSMKFLVAQIRDRL